MYKIVLIYTLCCLYSVNCNLNKEEGADCEWEGVKGTCVNSHRCLTTLDDKSPNQPICSEKGQDKIICCTDCELVNDTRNAVLSPTTGIYWKTGQKAWDKCLEYLIDLPYECKATEHAGMTRKLDEKKKCHIYDLWTIGGAPAVGGEVRNEFPHTTLLGYGDTLEKAKWQCGGSIISEKYILTAGHCTNSPHGGDLKFAAFGVLNKGTPVHEWQHGTVQRIISHPEYKPPHKYHDIALIETGEPIAFNKNVMPACLHLLKDSYDGEAVASTWMDPKAEQRTLADTPSTLHLKKYGKEECGKTYPVSRHLARGYDDTTQLCYGDKESGAQESCKGLGGEPLLINTQISSCIHTIIGVTSFGKPCSKSSIGYDVYTKVIHYVPWIESVVWP